MKKYRIIALVIALVLLAVPALAACGNKEAETTTTKAPETTKASEAETTTAAESKDDVIGILWEQDDSMINTYSLLAVNPDAPFVDADGNAVTDVELNTAGAEALINWLLSEEGEKAAADYGFAEYGEYLFYLLDGAPVSAAEIPQATEETKVIRMSTTTSVNDSGLLGYLLPKFEEKYGYTVEVASAGTGKAIAAAKMGNADLLLVHAKAQEEAFIEGGFSYVIDGLEKERLSYMYNFFVLVGPESDPVGVKSAANVKEGFKMIADQKYTFVSRGDNSGTHTKEISLWPEDLGITADAESFKDYTDWYTSANAGMGACLKMAEEMQAYILTDKATFLTYVANGRTVE